MKIALGIISWCLLVITYIVIFIPCPSFFLLVMLYICLFLEIAVIIFTIVLLFTKVKYRWIYLLLNPIFIFNLYSFELTAIHYFNGNAKLHAKDYTESKHMLYPYEGITSQDFVLFNQYRCEYHYFDGLYYSMQNYINDNLMDSYLKWMIKNIGFQNNVYKGYVPTRYEIAKELGRKDLDTFEVYFEDSLRIKASSKKLNFEFSKSRMNLFELNYYSKDSVETTTKYIYNTNDTLKKPIYFSAKYYPLIIITSGRIESEGFWDYEQDTLDGKYYNGTYADLFFIDLTHPKTHLIENVNLRQFKNQVTIENYTAEEMKKKFKHFH